MQAILEVFAQKMIGNLMHSADKDSLAHSRIVDLSLEVLSSYMTNSVACKQLSLIPVIKQIASAHISQFRILQDAR